MAQTWLSMISQMYLLEFRMIHIHTMKWQALFDSPKIKRTVHVVSGRCWVAAIIGESLVKAGITDNQKHELLLYGQDMKCWSWWWWDIASSYLPRLRIHNPLFSTFRLSHQMFSLSWIPHTISTISTTSSASLTKHSSSLMKCFLNQGYLQISSASMSLAGVSVYSDVTNFRRVLSISTLSHFTFMICAFLLNEKWLGTQEIRAILVEDDPFF